MTIFLLIGHIFYMESEEVMYMVHNIKKRVYSHIALLTMMGLHSLAIWGCANQNIDSHNSQDPSMSASSEKQSKKPDDVAALAAGLTEAMKQSKVLLDPKKRALFTGMEKLKRLPPDKSLELMSTWFMSGKSADGILREYGARRIRDKSKVDISEIRRQTKIGVPYEFYHFPKAVLLERQPITPKNVEFYGYIYPLVKDGKDIVDVWTTKDGTKPGSWHSPLSRHGNWPEAGGADNKTTQKKIYIATLPNRFRCFGLYPEDSNIEHAIFNCQKDEYGEQTSEKIPGPLSFQEICTKAQEFFDKNLRIIWESTSSGYM